MPPVLLLVVRPPTRPPIPDGEIPDDADVDDGVDAVDEDAVLMPLLCAPVAAPFWLSVVDIPRRDDCYVTTLALVSSEFNTAAEDSQEDLSLQHGRGMGSLACLIAFKLADKAGVVRVFFIRHTGTS